MATIAGREGKFGVGLVRLGQTRASDVCVSQNVCGDREKTTQEQQIEKALLSKSSPSSSSSSSASLEEDETDCWAGTEKRQTGGNRGRADGWMNRGSGWWTKWTARWLDGAGVQAGIAQARAQAQAVGWQGRDGWWAMGDGRWRGRRKRKGPALCRGGRWTGLDLRARTGGRLGEVGCLLAWVRPGRAVLALRWTWGRWPSRGSAVFQRWPPSPRAERTLCGESDAVRTLESLH